MKTFQHISPYNELQWEPNGSRSVWRNAGVSSTTHVLNLCHLIMRILHMNIISRSVLKVHFMSFPFYKLLSKGQTHTKTPKVFTKTCLNYKNDSEKKTSKESHCGSVISLDLIWRATDVFATDTFRHYQELNQ